MGKEIEKIALERGHSVVLTIDINKPGDPEQPEPLGLNGNANGIIS